MESNVMTHGQTPSKTARASLAQNRKRKVVIAVGSASDVEAVLAWRWLDSLFLDPARDAITFVHCVRTSFPGDYETSKVLPKPLDAGAETWLSKEAIVSCRKCFPGAAFVELPITLTSTAHMIVEYVRTRPDGMPDVVCVATRQDRGTIARAFMGSTSATVAHSCPTATLLVRSRVGPGSPAAGAELPAGFTRPSAPPPMAPSKVTEGAALAVTAKLAASAARAAAAEAKKRVAADVAEASGGDEAAEKEAAIKAVEAMQQEKILEKNMMAQAAVMEQQQSTVSEAAVGAEQAPSVPPGQLQRKARRGSGWEHEMAIRIAICLDGGGGSSLLVDWALANVVRPMDTVTLAHSEGGADMEQPPLFVENILDNCIERVAAALGPGGVARVLWVIPNPKNPATAVAALVENLQANEHELDLVVVGSRRWQPEGRLAGALKGAVSSIIPSMGSVSKELVGQLPMSTLVVSNESLVQWEQQDITMRSPLMGGA